MCENLIGINNNVIQICMMLFNGRPTEQTEWSNTMYIFVCFMCWEKLLMIESTCITFIF